MFDEQLRCSVFVAGIRCPITPFEVTEFPASTDQLDEFLTEFEDAPLCETVLTRYLITIGVNDLLCLLLNKYRKLAVY